MVKFERGVSEDLSFRAAHERAGSQMQDAGASVHAGSPSRKMAVGRASTALNQADSSLFADSSQPYFCSTWVLPAAPSRRRTSGDLISSSTAAENSSGESAILRC